MDVRTRTQVARWVGEFFRESAVLIAVLAPMELIIKDGFLTWREGSFIVVVTMLCIVAGFYAGLEKHADR